MGISLERVLASTAEGVLAVVRHGEQLLEVEVIGSRERLEATLGAVIDIEFSFSGVKAWKVLDTDDREAHGLFPAEPGAVRVVGAVQNVFDAGEGRSIADLYVQAGPEFFAVDCEDLPRAKLQAGTPVEITFEGVCCYPTWT